MLPGPVFHSELLTTARRPRYYAIRFLYGAALLFFIWLNDPGIQPWYNPTRGSGMSIAQLARLGRTLFTTFVSVQAAAVLLLTPALVAGVIADERQRKTLHYLLASRLSSTEIVVGKLAARFLHVGVFLAIGLPITSLLSLFGGVDPVLVPVAFSATATTAFFLGSLAILISAHARRSREAISLAYLLEVVWLFVPSLATLLMPALGGRVLLVYEWIRPVNQWIAPSSPFYLLISMVAPMRLRSMPQIMQALLWMMGLQVGYGLLFVLLAVLRLRPVAQKEGGGAGGWLAGLAQKKRFLPRPECGDDAMMWKERYAARTNVTTKLTAGITALVGMAGLVYLTYDFAKPAFVELVAYGYGSIAYQRYRGEFNGYLRGMCTLIYVLWALGVASAASAGVSSEREGDTWTSLLTTPLSGVEILRAKMLGAVWGLNWVGGLLAALWLIGLAAGAIHPLGFLLVVYETAVFVWFATALGTYVSLRSKNSGRALLGTIAILFMLNGGYLMCCIPLHTSNWLIFTAVTPLIEGFSLVSYEDVQRLFSGHWRRRPWLRDEESLLVGFLSTLSYLVAAGVLTLRAFHRFDEEADRPRRREPLGPAGGITLDEAVDDDPAEEPASAPDEP